MIWRSSRQSCAYTRALLRRPGVVSQTPCVLRRSISGLAGTGQSIASILALQFPGESQTPRTVEITGHIRTIRNQKRRSFAELGDGSTIQTLQVLLEPSQSARLGTGTAVTISGALLPSPPGKEQSHELHATTVKILGATDAEKYPMQKKHHSYEYLRTIPHLRLRSPFNALLARLRSDCEFYIASFYRSNQYVRSTPPVITSSDCEGAGEVFTMQPKEMGKTTPTGEQGSFFRGPKYLTVSSQLHLEALVHEHQRVWTLSPTFRAEKSDTPRHLSEFYMLEAELRTESLSDVMDVVENMIREVATKVQASEVGKELLAVKHTPEGETSKALSSRTEILQRRWQGLKRAYWPRITYTKAIELLCAAVEAGDATFQYPPSWDAGLQLEHEKFLAAEIGQGSPVFVTDYPQHVKAFYMLPSAAGQAHSDPSPPHQLPSDQSLAVNSPSTKPTVACFDLLLPELAEVAGGSLREHRLAPLLDAMERHGLVDAETDSQSGDSSAGNLEWYVDLRRYGSVPHGGFGLGFDRLLGYLAGVDNVRDVVPWPRYYGKCDC